MANLTSFPSTHASLNQCPVSLQSLLLHIPYKWQMNKGETVRKESVGSQLSQAEGCAHTPRPAPCYRGVV